MMTTSMKQAPPTTMMVFAACMLLGVCILPEHSIAKEQFNCSYPEAAYYSKKKGLNFNLTSLKLPSHSWYGAHDDNNNDTHSFKFYFNICGALSDGFPGSDNCDLGVNDNTAAVRVDQDGSCHKLGEYGRHGSKLLAYEIELHDDIRPTAGVNLWYKFGDTGMKKCNEKLPENYHAGAQISLLCGTGHRTSTKELKKNEVANLFVDEIGPCSYQIHAISDKGCPTQCPITAKGICSNNGYCGYDDSNQKARCFCEDGYTGDDCSSSSSSSSNSRSSSQAVGAMFGGIFLGLFGIAGFWYYKQRWQSSGRQQLEDTDEGFY